MLSSHIAHHAYPGVLGLKFLLFISRDAREGYEKPCGLTSKGIGKIWANFAELGSACSSWAG